MWEYLAVLLLGFWLGVAIFLYVSCYWLEEIFDLPPRNAPGIPSSGASGAHAQLKRLVARVVEEAAALPALARYAAEPTTPSIESSTYEDLLATAILNKVIERYQTENGSGGRSSGIHSASASPTPSERSSPRSLNSRNLRDISPPLREEEEISDWEEGEAREDGLELPRRVPFPEFGGDIVHNPDDTIDPDFDALSSSDIQAVDGSWEENWLFQKKKIKTIQSVPVPMLVPNSNTEYRVLIGDRDADDTTDLSDNASDQEEETAEFKSDMKRVLDSKHVIGGKMKIDELDYEPDSLTMDAEDEFETNDQENKTDTQLDDNKTENNNKSNNIDSKISNGDEAVLILGIDSGPLLKAEFALKEEIHRTLLNGNAEEYANELDSKINGDDKDVVDGLSHKGSTNTLSRHQKEREYEETVTVPVQRYADSLRRKHFDDGPQIPTRDTDKEDELIPGTIAYRERKKWLNYVEMPNNPYSPEAIQKRLSSKSTSSFFDSLSKSKDIDDDSIMSGDLSFKEDEEPVKEAVKERPKLYINTNINGSRSVSPSPRILKDVLAEDVPQYKRYGRDYYIREAKASSGGRKKSSVSDTGSLSPVRKATSLEQFESEFASPGLLIKQFNLIASNQQYTKFAKDEIPTSITTIPVNNKEILIEYEDANEQTLFSAKPALIEDDTDKKFEEILNSAYNTHLITSPLHIDIAEAKSPILDESCISSSSMEDSIKIYNVQTGEIVKSKPVESVDSLSPRYESDDNIDIDNVGDDSSQSVEADSRVLIEADSLNEEKYVDSLNSEGKDRVDIEILPQLPKVRELAKKFVSMDNLNEPVQPVKPPPPIWRRKSKENLLDIDKPVSKPVYMHSLTARSISKQFREELKLSMATPLTVPGGTKDIPEGIEEVTKESSRPGSPLPEPGTIKSKLAFFESLRNKFSK